MILKEADDHSLNVAELERLKALVPVSYHGKIERQIARIRIGAAGERSAAHFISREFGQSERMAVIHDLRIRVGEEYAQIDHLLIHRFQAAAWILETKNYSGRLSCDEHGDWTVWRNGRPQPVPSPVHQAQRQCRALELWLEANSITWIRQIHPVVLISPTSSVNRRKLPPDAHVVKSDNFPAWWTKQADELGLGTALRMLGHHVAKGMSHEDFRNLGQRLVSAHVPAIRDWRTMLRLPRSAIPLEPQQPAVRAPQVCSGAALADKVPQVITTSHGEIRITRIPDGRYALRHDTNEALLEIVRGACAGKAQWNPRFRNWLVSPERLDEILASIRGSRDQSPSGGRS